MLCMLSIPEQIHLGVYVSCIFTKAIGSMCVLQRKMKIMSGSLDGWPALSVGEQPTTLAKVPCSVVNQVSS
jgi:hypothetical protein